MITTFLRYTDEFWVPIAEYKCDREYAVDLAEQAVATLAARWGEGGDLTAQLNSVDDITLHTVQSEPNTWIGVVRSGKGHVALASVIRSSER